MQIEILALRHQLAVLQRWTKRPILSTADRFPLGFTFADMGAVVLSVGHRQAGNGNAWQRKLFDYIRVGRVG